MPRPVHVAHFGLAAALGLALAAPAFAIDMPPCDDPQITGKVKELAAGVTPEVQADAKKAAKVAAEITLDAIKELGNDTTLGKRTCYANPTLMRGDKGAKENVFGDVGLEYTVTADPQKPDGVTIAIATVARRKK